MKSIKILGKIGAGISLVFGLVACGSTSSDASSEKIIKVGTMGTYEPFSYYDKENNLTGYDIEVLQEADKKMENYAFEFGSGPWDTLFPGLDSDVYQLLANEFTSNPDRVAKYELTDESYFNDISQPIVREDETSIQSMADLAGKMVGVTVGDSHTRALEDYNKAHGELIVIKYYEADITSILQDLENGRIDATINNPMMAQRKAETLGLKIKVIDDTINKQPSIFIMKKGEEGQALKHALDAALAEMKEDGTLSKLSTKWFGKDYTN